MRKHHSALGGVALALALALALTLTGCSDDGTDSEAEDTPSATASSEPTSPSPTPKTPEEKAAAQLEEFLEVRDDFYRAATIDFERLDKVATGDEFLQIQAAVADIDQYDIKVTGKYVHTLAVPRNRGAEIRVVDCEDRTGVTERNKDGKDIKRNDPNGNPLRNPVPVEYTLVRDKGAWKVSNSDVIWDQSC
jgi:pectin methylesterase-like acyl-CoA thioesterase